MKILIGCSGWSYTDWIGSFYPRDLEQRQGEWLSYYSRFFPTAEVNTTFYSIPEKRNVESWLTRTGDRQFEFTIKLPSSITHERLVSGDWDGIESDFRLLRENCLVPLNNSGRLGSILVQLSPEIRYPSHMDALHRLLGLLSSYSVAVEFRHLSWIDRRTEEIRGDVLDALQMNGAASVILDSPVFPATRAITSAEAYIRFHGRNRDVWFTGVGEGDSRINRYDYLYTEAQLSEWVPRILDVASSTALTRIYFNNHGRAKAARNALELMDLLGMAHEGKEIRISEQVKLESFT